MQIGVIRGTTPQIFNAMFFPEVSQETRSWVSQQFSDGLQALGEQGRAFVNRAVDLSRQYFTSQANSIARSLTRQITSLGDDNMIHVYDTVEQVQRANRVSQRYFMANPRLRSLYHRQLCDGYSDSYVDLEPGRIGEDHYDYRRMTEGLVVDVQGETEDDYRWYARMHPEDLHEGDRRLDHEERHMLARGCELIEMCLDAKVDPSDIFGGRLEI